MSKTRCTEPSGFTHSALFYRGAQDYVDAVAGFVIDGLGLGQPVLVAVPQDNLALLRDALGDAAAEVTMADMTEVGRNPGRVFGLFGAFVGKHPGRRVRIVGECIWPGRSAERYPACVKHEASANKAFGSRELMALCPYDAERLDDDTLADARLTHPLVWQAGSVDHSGEYAPDVALARYNQPLPYNPGAISYTVRKLADLSGARSFASRYAGWHGLSREGIADLQLIATELATNSLRRTGGACRLAFWPHNGHLVCEARDRGRFENGSVTPRVTSPVTPHPPIDSELFVVNAIADLVRTHVTAGATTIQAYLRLGQVPAEAR